LIVRSSPVISTREGSMSMKIPFNLWLDYTIKSGGKKEPEK